MARKGLIESNERKIQLANKKRDMRMRLKSIIMDRSLDSEQRFEASLKIASLPRNSAMNRVRSRCAKTGRARAVYRCFQLSRMAFRELAVKGQLPGIRRASW